ncbi:hypothetical protein BKA70DRAFT_1219840 [Coprinopsis sp. MPI-PUGE-AT-0042]|nr:hypothetical protein BKA70DRAFT_1219840 [Coprinopsis sp. MPI-PUGE-AT-0042]
MDPMLMEPGQPVPQEADAANIPATHGDLEYLYRHVMDMFNGTMQSVEVEVKRILAGYSNEETNSAYSSKAAVPLRQAISNLERQVSELEAFKTENIWANTEVPKLVTQHPLTIRALEDFTAAHELIDGRLAEIKSLMDQVDAPAASSLSKTLCPRAHTTGRLGGFLRVLAVVNTFLAATLVDKIYFENAHGSILLGVLFLALGIERAFSAV